MKPTLHPASEKMLVAVTNNLPQSLLLTSDSGVGLGTISKYIANLRGVKPTVILPEKDDKIDLEKGIINVDIMRRLYDETRTKTAGERIIIIDYAERMTGQAQNAFLKLLEEPGDGVYFILVSHSLSKLLPTILSRTENLNIKPITTSQSEEMLDSLSVTDKTKRSQLLFLASGLPAELVRLTTDEKYFNQMCLLVRDARELLRGTAYQKLLIAHRYKDNRDQVLQLLSTSAKILKQSIISNPQIDAINHVEKLLETYEHIEANGNIRLCLARLAV